MYEIFIDVDLIIYPLNLEELLVYAEYFMKYSIVFSIFYIDFKTGNYLISNLLYY